MSRNGLPPSNGSVVLVELLARSADGDTAAFRDFYDRTSAKLYGIILRILVERGESEDVLQEVYVTIWRKAAEFDAARASPVTWTATIARNRAIDRLRARGSRPSAPLDEAADVRDEAPLADARIDADRDTSRIHAALADLEPRHAAAIRSCYFEGLTYESLAVREGIPVGTLKSWVRRGLLRMKLSMAEHAQ
ncbi:RNA polymerase sigma factor [Polymorphobacter glacialis]|uniref:RNA polymerase sigma factor n=1 Tax=Sandarakinorhabdus glacialis TaxID=1614636 RepID=A0A916ZXZ5_9SPHN|nr:sigma-70 family RNA polymerase sigma factor [Polymorphobacter glacialis]GGE18578.1 RNA polymerase sigma factor [Polymorphobacter glacialis]